MSEKIHNHEFIINQHKFDNEDQCFKVEDEFLSTLSEIREKKQEKDNIINETNKIIHKESDGTASIGEILMSKFRHASGEDTVKSSQSQEKKEANIRSLLDGFLKLLREKDIKVSTPEWLQFLNVVEKKAHITELNELVNNDELLTKFRLFSKTILIKNKHDEAAFHEAFDEYFELISKIFKNEIEKEEDEQLRKNDKNNMTEDEKQEISEALEEQFKAQEIKPDIKEQLGIKEVDENIDSNEDEHLDNEQVHGGKQDQHNDILKKQDLSKQGGGNKKEGPSGEGDKGNPSQGKGKEEDAGHGKGDKGQEGQGKGDSGEAGAGKGDKGESSGMGTGSSGMEIENKNNENSSVPLSPQNTMLSKEKEGILVGGGKGKSIVAERIKLDSIHSGNRISKEDIDNREERMSKVDRRLRYETRPDRTSMREVIRNLRRIITDVTDIKSRNVNLKSTVKNFARRDFRFDFEKEREKQPEIILFIDVGGPVDEWSPLMKEVTEEMSKGLSKLEVYLFHNNLYGYVWKPDPKNLLASSYAKPNSLIDIKKLIKKRKKVIIYGDAEMSESELEEDCWPPNGNEKRVEKYGMGGEECLEYIKRKSNTAVWINPIFKKEWNNRDYSGTINNINSIIPMHDLTIGGVEDAIKELMKK